MYTAIAVGITVKNLVFLIPNSTVIHGNNINNYWQNKYRLFTWIHDNQLL